MTNSRLTDIEIHLMHHDKAIQELNDEVIRQQRLLDDLIAEVALVREQLQGMALATTGTDEESPPPHY